MVFIGWGISGLIFIVCILLVIYDEQAGLVIGRLAPWLDLRVSGILAIFANIASVSVRLYMMLNPPDTVVIYWNLVFYSTFIFGSVIIYSIVRDIGVEIQFSTGLVEGEGQVSMNESIYDLLVTTIGLLLFIGYCMRRIEVLRAR